VENKIFYTIIWCSACLGLGIVLGAVSERSLQDGRYQVSIGQFSDCKEALGEKELEIRNLRWTIKNLPQWHRKIASRVLP
jgi:hypothetical protein